MFERHQMHTVNRITFTRMLSEASSQSDALYRRLFLIKTMKSQSSEGIESETAYIDFISDKQTCDGCLFDSSNGK